MNFQDSNCFLSNNRINYKGNKYLAIRSDRASFDSNMEEMKMTKARKDARGRALRKGEIQRKSDLKYIYTYTDPLGRRRYIYANDLTEIREKEDKLKKDQLDGLDLYVAGKASHGVFPTMKSLDGVNKKNDVKNQAAEEVKAEPEKIDFSKVKIEPLFEETVDFDTFSKSDFRAVKVKECVAVPKSKKLLQFTLDDGTGIDRIILSGIHAYYEPEELVGKTLIAIVNLPPGAMMGIDSCGMLLSAIHEEEGEEKLHLLIVDDHIPAGAKLY